MHTRRERDRRVPNQRHPLRRAAIRFRHHATSRREPDKMAAGRRAARRRRGTPRQAPERNGHGSGTADTGSTHCRTAARRGPVLLRRLAALPRRRDERLPRVRIQRSPGRQGVCRHDRTLRAAPPRRHHRATPHSPEAGQRAADMDSGRRLVRTALTLSGPGDAVPGLRATTGTNAHISFGKTPRACSRHPDGHKVFSAARTAPRLSHTAGHDATNLNFRASHTTMEAAPGGGSLHL